MQTVDFSHPNAQPFEIGSGENAILLIHGFTGSPSHMRPIGDAAAAAGFSARGILLPGHGTSIADMEKSSWQAWLSACQEAMREMRAKYKRVTVAGLSMGGILSLLVAEEFEPDALILFAPALRYKKSVNYLSPLVKHFMKVSKWKPHGYADFLTEYDFGYLGAPVSKVEDMTRLQKMANAGIAKIECPTLVIQSHRDESVHATVPDRIMRGIRSKVKEICWVDQSPHVCTIGPDRAYVGARVVDFLRRHGV